MTNCWKVEYGGFVQQTLLATTDGFTQMERKMVTIVCWWKPILDIYWYICWYDSQFATALLITFCSWKCHDDWWLGESQVDGKEADAILVLIVSSRRGVVAFLNYTDLVLLRGWYLPVMVHWSPQVVILFVTPLKVSEIVSRQLLLAEVMSHVDTTVISFQTWSLH